MKRVFFIIFAVIITAPAFAQQFANLDRIVLSKREDYKPVEKTVKECVNYLLGHALNKDDESDKNAARFTIRWMNGTPDFNFDIDPDMTKFINKKNEDLNRVFIACLVKPALDKPEMAKDGKAMKIACFQLLAQFCADPAHKVVMTKELKKLIEANNKGNVESVLNMVRFK